MDVSEFRINSAASQSLVQKTDIIRGTICTSKVLMKITPFRNLLRLHHADGCLFSGDDCVGAKLSPQKTGGERDEPLGK